MNKIETNQPETNKPKTTLIRVMAIASAVVIALMPFHAFLTVWFSDVFGNYTELRLWKEYVLWALVVGAVYACLTQPKLRQRLLRGELLFGLIGLYFLLLLLRGASALVGGDVSLMALGYGLLLDSRFLVFFMVTWLVTQQDDLIARAWRQLLLIPAAFVSLFAVLQYFVLAPDFLKHFGYGPDTISPVATVDQKSTYQRVQSTLRGANPLGAYLVLVIAALSVLIVKARRLRWWLVVMLLVSSLALAVTFSRSAWIGVVVSAAWLLWTAMTSGTARQVLLVAGSAAVLAFTAVGYSLRDNDHFQNAFFHTDENSLSAQSSNTGRVAAWEAGVRDIMREPLGRGPGTAGPASFYNTKPARIAENYYLQLGQEVGVIGLTMFILITVGLAGRFWQRRQELLPRLLLASLIGLTAVNMFSHAWTDDTLAYVWWGLAGAALAATTPTKAALAAAPAGKQHAPVE